MLFLKKNIKTNYAVEEILKSLKNSATSSKHNVFSALKFRFWQKGRIGLYRIATKTKIVGKIEGNSSDVKIITLTIYPGYTFWVMSVITLLAVIIVAHQMVTMGPTVTTGAFALFLFAFQCLNIIESSWQGQYCEDKILNSLKP